MNFLKSVFTDPPEPERDSPESPNPWTFGSLMQTLASKSETVISDLEDLSSGLKHETSIIRDAAVESLESGATVAQTSLESVGQAIDDIGSTVWSLLAPQHNIESLKYSRFDAQLRSIERDASTYCDDIDGFSEWKDGNAVEFDYEEVLRENEVVRGFYRDLVESGKVDQETFWGRYWYRVFKLREVEKARAEVVRRAVLGHDDEDLSWDVDDDEEDNVGGLGKESNVSVLSCKEEVVVKASREELRKRLIEVDVDDDDLSWDIEDDDQPAKL